MFLAYAVLPFCFKRSFVLEYFELYLQFNLTLFHVLYIWHFDFVVVLYSLYKCVLRWDVALHLKCEFALCIIWVSVVYGQRRLHHASLNKLLTFSPHCYHDEWFSVGLVNGSCRLVFESSSYVVSWLSLGMHWCLVLPGRVSQGFVLQSQKFDQLALSPVHFAVYSDQNWQLRKNTDFDLLYICLQILIWDSVNANPNTFKATLCSFST